MALQQRDFVLDGYNFTHHYLCNYKPYFEGVDRLSYSLIRFKKSETIDVRAWTDCSVEALKRIHFRTSTAVLRSLHSSEEKVGAGLTSPLDILGLAIASAIDGQYLPHLLRKNKVIPPLKGLKLEAREKLMKNLYDFEKEGTISSILIVDDIFTSGTTMAAIIRAIRKKLSCPILLFTLKATDQASNKGSTLSGVAYSWKPEKGWTQVQEPDESYHHVADLKKLIEADFQ